MADKEALAWEMEHHADYPLSAADLAAELALERARAETHLRARIAVMEATLAALSKPPLEVYRDNEGDVLLHQLPTANPRKEVA